MCSVLCVMVFLWTGLLYILFTTAEQLVHCYRQERTVCMDWRTGWRGVVSRHLQYIHVTKSSLFAGHCWCVISDLGHAFWLLYCSMGQIIMFWGCLCRLCACSSVATFVNVITHECLEANQHDSARLWCRTLRYRLKRSRLQKVTISQKVRTSPTEIAVLHKHSSSDFCKA